MGGKVSDLTLIDDLAIAIKAKRDNDINNALIDIKKNLNNKKTKKTWQTELCKARSLDLLLKWLNFPVGDKD